MSPGDHPRHEKRRRDKPSRRSCLSVFAAAATAVVTTALPARARIDWHKVDIWKPYRRDDLGFEVEMPGEPKIEEEDDAHASSVYAELMFVGMAFGFNHTTFKRNAATIEDLVKEQRKTAQRLNGRIIREAPFTMDGLPAVEIVSEFENAFVNILRAVVIGNRMVAVDVMGGPDIADDPSARRFLNSFRLLPTARKAD